MRKVYIGFCLCLGLMAGFTSLAQGIQELKEKTVQEYELLIKKSEKEGDLAKAAHYLYELGGVYQRKKDYTNALKYFQKAKTYYQKENSKESLLKTSYSISSILEKTGKYSKAIKELEEGLAFAVELNKVEFMEYAYDRLYKDYKAIGDAKKSTQYFGFYNALKKEKENAELEKQNKQNENQINKLKEQKKSIEKEKEITESQLFATAEELIETKDSMQVLELENRERQMKINLHEKEKRIQDMMLKEKQSQLEREKIVANEAKAIAEKEQWVIYSMIAGFLLVGYLGFVMYRNNKQQQRAAAKIEEQHKNITNSINYAQRIQNAMLPHEKSLNFLLSDAFIFFKPKDVVSGDFYWFYDTQSQSAMNEYSPEDVSGAEPMPSASASGKVILAAADCTGHGVPGALMSMIGYNLLNEIVNKSIHDSDKILTELHRNVRFALKQDKNNNNDGMDMALCVVDKDRKEVHYSGAKNPLVYIQNGELTHLKGDKHPIGGSQGETKRDFTRHTIKTDIPTTFYIFSDGYPDQFGGPENKKFMIKNFKELLLEIHQKPFSEQKEILEGRLQAWKGKEKQMDDILVMGFRVG